MSSSRKQDGDGRFLRVHKDPRFWEMPERDHKIKIDKRFKSMFSDKRFKVKYTVDKRGRPINHTSTEDLKRFYNVSESEEEEEEEKQGIQKKGGAALSGREEEDEEEDDDDEEEEQSGSSGSDQESDSDSGPDLARGKGNVETSSDEDEDEVDLVLRREEEEMEHAWGDLCKDAPRSEEVSARLAVCNMDWDRLKARDLLVLLGSFAPTGGAVLSVKIFPSEFGKERLKLEETQGPPELRSLPNDSEDDTEEEKVHREKLRDYQFKRLKYFYAVVECDAAITAQKIYEECDGYEYESSCSCLDLRFIPDDVSFDEEPSDAASDVNMVAYTPKLFTSSGSTTSKVQLTWDETDHERVTAMNRKFNKNELLDMDFKAYLASSSEEEEEAGDGGAEPREEGRGDTNKEKKNDEQMRRYQELLRGIREKEEKLQEDKDMEMEVTWVPGLKETTEELVKKKLEEQKEQTPWEEFLQKKKEKKKLKKRKQGQEEEQEEEQSEDDLPADVDLTDPFFTEELDETHTRKRGRKKKRREQEERTAQEEEELQKQKAEMLLLMDDGDGDLLHHQHFNYDQIVEQQNLSSKKKRRLLKKGAELLEQDHFQVDVKDPRFQAMFTSHLFNLDPSHPSYRNTAATQSFQTEKQRRRQQEGGRARPEATPQPEATPPGETAPIKAMDPSLSLLVKSIKNKTQEFQSRRKEKGRKV